MLLRRSTRWLLIGGLLAVFGIAGWRVWPRPAGPPPVERNPEFLWMFEQPERGGVFSSPTLANGRLYFGSVFDVAFAAKGFAYALDADTGKVVWRFDHDGKMVKTFSSPAVADGRLFIGDGMHGNNDCHLYALDAVTGKELWAYFVASHVESSPTVEAGVVYVCGGDEGVLALDVVTGQRKWQFNDSLHIDSSPAIAGGRVYVGSGDNKKYQTYQYVCLDAKTGAVVWRIPAELPVWGSALVGAGRVFFGIGQSNLLAPRQPLAGGGLMCLDAATGQRLWYCDAKQAVTCRPASDETRVYFGADDGTVYAANRADGQVAWKADVGSGVIACRPCSTAGCMSSPAPVGSSASTPPTAGCCRSST